MYYFFCLQKQRLKIYQQLLHSFAEKCAKKRNCIKEPMRLDNRSCEEPVADSMSNEKISCLHVRERLGLYNVYEAQKPYIIDT